MTTERPVPIDSTAIHAFGTPSGWNQRYSNQSTGAAAPGTFTHSDAGNRQFYRTKFAALDQCLKVVGASLLEQTVLDAAGGPGQFVPYFLKRGVEHVTVADFSPVALDLVHRNYKNQPRVATHLWNLTDPLPVSLPAYDWAFVMEAIFLLPTDEALARAIANMAAALKPQGHLVISDIFPDRTVRQNDYVVRRSRGHFEQVLDRSGFDVQAYVPQTFAFNRRLFGRFQRWVERADPLLYLVDRAAITLGLRPPVGSRADVKYLVAIRRTEGDLTGAAPIV